MGRSARSSAVIDTVVTSFSEPGATATFIPAALATAPPSMPRSVGPTVGTTTRTGITASSIL